MNTNQERPETIEEIDRMVFTDEISLENFMTDEDILITSTMPTSLMNPPKATKSKGKKRKMEEEDVVTSKITVAITLSHHGHQPSTHSQKPIPAPGQQSNAARIAELELRQIRKEEESLASGHIKITLSDRLYDYKRWLVFFRHWSHCLCCDSKDKFVKYHVVNDGKQVIVANKNKVDATGIGTFQLHFTSRNILTLRIVLHMRGSLEAYRDRGMYRLSLKDHVDDSDDSDSDESMDDVSDDESVNEVSDDESIRSNAMTVEEFMSGDGERSDSNRTLVEMVNCMLNQSIWPTNLWEEALLTACHIHNRITSRVIPIHPYTLWKRRKPNRNYFKVWGCVAYYRTPDPKRSKLGACAIKSIFVGYANNKKTYRLLDKDSGVIVESRDVEFFEDKFLEDVENSDRTLDTSLPGTSQDYSRMFQSSCLPPKGNIPADKKGISDRII
ncbi:hypothetical protein OSB04_011805 [Centaurea solstitialis]|uniref:Retroviral polymerase SH3-like domain-containing protein n=1 Tax=Centaurea solstitialis TaxID=347529 RepID=A0AA38TN89_9ASTR|nr:hypothetical protein OSB04_011805 [Centaurea solstitialis]